MLTYLLNGDTHSSFKNKSAEEVIKMISSQIPLTDLELDIQTGSATVYSSPSQNVKVIQFEDIVGSFNYAQGISRTECCNAVEVFFQNEKVACSNCGAPVNNLFSLAGVN